MPFVPAIVVTFVVVPFWFTVEDGGAVLVFVGDCCDTPVSGCGLTDAAAADAD